MTPPAATPGPLTVPPTLRPVDLYQEFVDLNLGILIQEAETALGVRVTGLRAPETRSDVGPGSAATALPPDLVRFLAPSEVSTWMRLAQLQATVREGLLVGLLGLQRRRVKDLLDFRPPAPAEARSIWFLWSLTFCPSNLSSSFHILSWGFFNTLDTGHIRLFELDRVRKGFVGCRFRQTRGVAMTRSRSRIKKSLEYLSPVGDAWNPLAEAERVLLAQERAAERVRRQEASRDRQALRRQAQIVARRARKVSKTAADARSAGHKLEAASRVAFRVALAGEKREARRRTKAEFIRDVVNLHQLGRNQTEIAVALGVDQPRVALVLTRLGFRTYRKHRFGGD